MTIKRRVASVLAGAALAVGTIGGAGAVTVATAAPADAATAKWVWCNMFGYNCPVKKCYIKQQQYPGQLFDRYVCIRSR